MPAFNQVLYLYPVLCLGLRVDDLARVVWPGPARHAGDLDQARGVVVDAVLVPAACVCSTSRPVSLMVLCFSSAFRLLAQGPFETFELSDRGEQREVAEPMHPGLAVDCSSVARVNRPVVLPLLRKDVFDRETLTARPAADRSRRGRRSQSPPRKLRSRARGKRRYAGFSGKRHADLVVARPVRAGHVKASEMCDDPVRELVGRRASMGLDDVGDNSAQVGARKAQELAPDDPALGGRDDRVDRQAAEGFCRAREARSEAA